MKTDELTSTHASVITVLSMQFITIFGSGLYDPWDFIISAICFLFGFRLFRIGYEDWLGRFLISANVAIYFVFSVIYPISYLVEFWQFVVLKAGPGDFFEPARFLEGTALELLQVGYHSTITNGELLSFFLVGIVWLLARKRDS